jgi:hypothetical protein
MTWESLAKISARLRVEIVAWKRIPLGSAVHSIEAIGSIAAENLLQILNPCTLYAWTNGSHLDSDQKFLVILPLLLPWVLIFIAARRFEKRRRDQGAWNESGSDRSDVCTNESNAPSRRNARPDDRKHRR